MNTETKNLAMTALSGFAVCLILGLIFFGANIFSFHHSHAVVVLLNGFYGAVFYSVLKYRNRKEQILTAFVILILDLIVHGKGMSSVLLLRDILFIAALLGAVYCYKIFINKYKALPLFVRSLALPLFFGVFNILATIILIIIFNPGEMKINTALFLNANYAAIVGLGLGLGFDLYEKLKPKIV
jgi:drug/metabolite transporter (DMT)-like permease